MNPINKPLYGRLFILSLLVIISLLLFTSRINVDHYTGKTQKKVTFDYSKLERLSALATIEIHLSTLFQSRKNIKDRGLLDIDDNYIKGITRFEGKAKIGINLKHITVEIPDQTVKNAIITLPEPEIIFFALSTKLTNPIFFFQDATSQDKFNFMKHARISVKKEMKKKIRNNRRLLYLAERNAEKLLINFYGNLGWNIQIKSPGPYLEKSVINVVTGGEK